jgi:hypothetical protein
MEMNPPIELWSFFNILLIGRDASGNLIRWASERFTLRLGRLRDLGGI